MLFNLKRLLTIIITYIKGQTGHFLVRHTPLSIIINLYDAYSHTYVIFTLTVAFLKQPIVFSITNKFKEIVKMSSSTTSVDTLIIRGGFAGAKAAQGLADKGFNVALVDRKDYFEVTIAMLRNLADFPTMNNKPRVKHQDFIQGQFIHAGVKTLSDNQAILDNDQIIEFKQAIIATGTNYSALPIAKSNDLYAIGDVADLHDLKMAAFAAKQADLLVKNIVKKKRKKTKPHKPQGMMGLFPIGQKQGVAQLPFGAVTWNFLINIKNKDLFIGKVLGDIKAR